MRIETDIRLAIQQGASFSTVAQYVAQPPVLSSAGDGKSVAEYADYAPDPNYPDTFIKFWKFQDFAYWHLNDKTAQIVGIAWDQQQKPIMFYAIVLTPD